jgi:hypothetical protein
VRARVRAPEIAPAQLPERLANIEVQAAAASDYDVLFGGVQ